MDPTQAALWPDPPAWWQGPLWALDYETTGPNPRTCLPVSVALIRADPAAPDPVAPGLARILYHIIDPGVEVPAEAAAVHGLTTERVRAEGRPLEAVLPTLEDWLEDWARSGEPLVIFNAPFDWTLTYRLFGYLHEGPIVDPLLCDKVLDKYRKGSRTLSTMAPVYGVQVTDAHDALADCRMAVEVTRALAGSYPALGRMPLESLVVQQATWYEGWRVEVNAYWARMGKPQRAEPGWPRADVPGELADVAMGPPRARGAS